VARLLRSTGQSVIRKPAVVDSAVTFRPVAVRLAPSSTLGRRSRYRLNPPSVVAPAVVFRPVLVKTVRQPSRAQHTLSTLRPPAVVASAVTFRAVSTKLVVAPKPRLVQFELRPPVVLGSVATPFLASPVTVKLARALQPRRVWYVLRPPTVVGAVVAPFLASPVVVKLTRALQPRRVRYVLQPPASVGASITFRPVQVTRAPRPTDATRRTVKQVRPPATLQQIVAFLAAPIRVFLTGAARPRPTVRIMRKPTVVTPAITFRPLVVKLARRPAQAGAAKSRLQKPTVLFAFIASIVTGYFTSRPGGVTDSTPAERDFDTSTGGQSTGNPDQSEFDPPNPRGQS
jgi:hypothetical protein